MTKLSEIDIGSSLLSTFILIGFIASAFVCLRLTIIGINYIKDNYLQGKGEDNNKKKEIGETKGF